MSNYAIMRMEKLKSRASLVGALKHDTREKVPQNADPTRTKKNAMFGSFQKAMQTYTENLPEKVRKDAVHAVELVFTASPEWFENKSDDEIRLFGFRARKWCHDLFGKDNELLFAVHFDEKTPHFHAIFMPLVDGKLNAKSIIGGTKFRMKELQDDFYTKVGKKCGMDRGESREHVRHTEVSEFSKVMKAEKADIEKREKVIEEVNKHLSDTMPEDKRIEVAMLSKICAGLTTDEKVTVLNDALKQADKIRENKALQQAKPRGRGR